jgi:hypothetical protein
LNRVNRESGGKITATEFERNTIDGTGEAPEQYKIPLAAANEAGLPALVVTAGSEVLSVIPKPTTAEQIVEAAR